MKYRLATSADLKALAELRWAFRTEDAETPNRVKKEEFIAACVQFLTDGLSSNQWVYWIAEDENEIIAQIFVQCIKTVPKPERLEDMYGYVTNVYTKPSYRGQGIGFNLMKRVKDWAEAEELETLIVWPSERSRTFYERLGFKSENDIMEYELRPE